MKKDDLLNKLKETPEEIDKILYKAVFENKKF